MGNLFAGENDNQRGILPVHAFSNPEVQPVHHDSSLDVISSLEHPSKGLPLGT
jgi:hypothetical protein